MTGMPVRLLVAHTGSHLHAKASHCLLNAQWPHLTQTFCCHAACCSLHSRMLQQLGSRQQQRPQQLLLLPLYHVAASAQQT